VKKVRILADARREFYNAITYYEKARQGLGKRFRKAAEATFLMAGASPQHGKPGVGGTRRLLVKGFPFSVV
jgi:plasmid stabilization system protein ParE